MAAYCEPHRHYHNQQHILECLAELDRSRHLAQQPHAVELALWFHDAVYDPKEADNEERSAELARQCLRENGIDLPVVQTVAELILATKHNEGKSEGDAGLMLDVDLSILGQPEERFLEYEEQVRQEYAWVPRLIFRRKRANILEGFLARERLYSTDLFYCRYEEQARRNLQTSVRRLRRWFG